MSRLLGEEPSGLKAEDRAHERRGLMAIDGALALITILLIVQVCLLTAALEAYLAGHREATFPAAIASLVLFAGVFGLYRFTRRVDRVARGK